MSLTVNLWCNRPHCVFTGNITHNLMNMADAAGLIHSLYRGGEYDELRIGVVKSLLEGHFKGEECWAVIPWDEKLCEILIVPYGTEKEADEAMAKREEECTDCKCGFKKVRFIVWEIS